MGPCAGVSTCRGSWDPQAFAYEKCANMRDFVHLLKHQCLHQPVATVPALHHAANLMHMPAESSAIPAAIVQLWTAMHCRQLSIFRQACVGFGRVAGLRPRSRCHPGHS